MPRSKDKGPVNIRPTRRTRTKIRSIQVGRIGLLAVPEHQLEPNRVIRFVGDMGRVLFEVCQHGEKSIEVRGVDSSHDHTCILTITPNVSNSVYIGLRPHAIQE